NARPSPTVAANRITTHSSAAATGAVTATSPRAKRSRKTAAATNRPSALSAKRVRSSSRASFRKTAQAPASHMGLRMGSADCGMAIFAGSTPKSEIRDPNSAMNRDRALGALLGAAVGDALGMPVDGLSHQNVRLYYKGVK